MGKSICICNEHATYRASHRHSIKQQTDCSGEHHEVATPDAVAGTLHVHLQPLIKPRGPFFKCFGFNFGQIGAWMTCTFLVPVI